MSSFLQFAQIQSAHGNAASAEQQILAKFHEQPHPPSADFGLALAHCNLQLERLEQAQACLDRVLLDHGDSVELLQLAYSLALRRNEGGCDVALRQRLQAHCHQLPIALLWLDSLIAQLDAPAAIAWAQQLMQQWPQEETVLQAIRDLAWQLQDATLLPPSTPMALWEGRRHWLEGNRELAEQMLRLCLSDCDQPLELKLQALHTLVFQLHPQQAEPLLTPYLQLLTSSPNWAWCFGRALLAAGVWPLGWQLYEQRYHSSDRAQILPPGFPLIGMELLQTPEALKSCHILLYGEQGIGDVLMFAAMLPQLQADLDLAGGSLQLLLPPRLVPLMQASFPKLAIASSYPDQSLRQLNLACSIGSLGQIYRSSAQSFKGHSPHLQVPDQLKSTWRQRLGELGPGLKVGIAWRGGGTLGNRQQRSLALEQLLPVLQQPGIHWINLQYGHDPGELAGINQNHGIEIHHFSGISVDLLATAGLTAVLDLVITVQQTALHIAAGLGVPVWGLLPYRAEWRYGLDGAQMAWYPSVELFRQKAPGDWQEMIKTMACRLGRLQGDQNGLFSPISNGDRS
jgi:tetratricopeptide (TPR) repeat protein